MFLEQKSRKSLEDSHAVFTVTSSGGMFLAKTTLACFSL